MRLFFASLLALAACTTTPTPPSGTDADTAAWWSITGDLSSDAMEGRDTGSPAYDRAAKYVADRFTAAAHHATGRTTAPPPDPPPRPRHGTGGSGQPVLND